MGLIAESIHFLGYSKFMGGGGKVKYVFTPPHFDREILILTDLRQFKPIFTSVPPIFPIASPPGVMYDREKLFQCNITNDIFINN